MRARRRARDDRRARGRACSLTPLAAGLLVVVCVAGVARVMGDLNLRSAERERVADRANLVANFMKAGAPLYNAHAIEDQVARRPSAPAAPTLDETLLQSFSVSAAGDRNLMVLLLDRQGRRIVSRPAAASLPLGKLGRAWTTALHGHSELSPVFALGRGHAWARTVPVGGASPWAILVTVEDLDHGWLQHLYEGLGSFGSGPGGLVVLDARGVVAAVVGSTDARYAAGPGRAAAGRWRETAGLGFGPRFPTNDQDRGERSSPATRSATGSGCRPSCRTKRPTTR